jgi:AcrR family transcriptional regulator
MKRMWLRHLSHFSRRGDTYMDAERPLQPRLRKDAELNRSRIIAAAREVFRDRGIGATLNDVARSAGVGVGTVYRRFSDKEELVDALFEDMIETVDAYTRAALAEPDAWVGLTVALEKVCEVQALDRGLREVMLGTGRGPERQAQMHERVAPMLDQLVARAKEQGGLRPDIVAPDFPALQLMLGAVTEHIGEPELWRRYLALLIDGMRARPDLTPLPEKGELAGEFEQAIVDSSTRDARRRAAEG